MFLTPEGLASMVRTATYFCDFLLPLLRTNRAWPDKRLAAWGVFPPILPEIDRFEAVRRAHRIPRLISLGSDGNNFAPEFPIGIFGDYICGIIRRPHDILALQIIRRDPTKGTFSTIPSIPPIPNRGSLMRSPWTPSAYMLSKDMLWVVGRIVFDNVSRIAWRAFNPFEETGWGISDPIIDGECALTQDRGVIWKETEVLLFLLPQHASLWTSLRTLSLNESQPIVHAALHGDLVALASLKEVVLYKCPYDGQKFQTEISRCFDLPRGLRGAPQLTLMAAHLYVGCPKGDPMWPSAGPYTVTVYSHFQLTKAPERILHGAYPDTIHSGCCFFESSLFSWYVSSREQSLTWRLWTPARRICRAHVIPIQTHEDDRHFVHSAGMSEEVPLWTGCEGSYRLSLLEYV